MPSKNLSDLTQDTRNAVEQLLQFAADSGISVIVTETLRTCAEQDAYYAKGRTAPGPKVTGTPGCRSWHTHGRAVDMLVKEPDGSIVHDGTDDRYVRLGEHSRTLGFRWGGDFGDPGHFEYHPGLTIGQVCPDPSDCSHLGQPSSSKPPDQPSSASSSVALVSLAVGAAAYVAADMAWGLTDRLLDKLAQWRVT